MSHSSEVRDINSATQQSRVMVALREEPCFVGGRIYTVTERSEQHTQSLFTLLLQATQDWKKLMNLYSL